MKHLLGGIAIVAALAFAAPVWAQHAKHGGRATPVGRSAENSASQLNADELARLQSGQFASPPPSTLPYGKPPRQGETWGIASSRSFE